MASVILHCFIIPPTANSLQTFARLLFSIEDCRHNMVCVCVCVCLSVCVCVLWERVCVHVWGVCVEGGVKKTLRWSNDILWTCLIVRLQ